jgi:hypothetical protein
MKLDLTEELADELRSTLESTLLELSSEIADTDNAAYRRELRDRRERLVAIQTQLGVSDG